jgi:hypothetical protein
MIRLILMAGKSVPSVVAANQWRPVASQDRDPGLARTAMNPNGLKVVKA